MKLIDTAKVIRSKNAGPFELTLDIIFQNEHDYMIFKDKGLLTPEFVAGLYTIDVKDILHIIWFAPANAVKITLKRWAVCGCPGEKDVYGAQQHAPLLNIEY